MVVMYLKYLRITGCPINLVKTLLHINHTSTWPSKLILSMSPPNQFYKMLECTVFHMDFPGQERKQFSLRDIFGFHRIFTSTIWQRLAVTQLIMISTFVSPQGQQLGAGASLKQDSLSDSKLGQGIEKTPLKQFNEYSLFLFVHQSHFLKTSANEQFPPCTDLICCFLASRGMTNVHK